MKEIDHWVKVLTELSGPSQTKSLILWQAHVITALLQQDGKWKEENHPEVPGPGWPGIHNINARQVILRMLSQWYDSRIFVLMRAYTYMLN